MPDSQSRMPPSLTHWPKYVPTYQPTYECCYKPYVCRDKSVVCVCLANFQPSLSSYGNDLEIRRSRPPLISREILNRTRQTAVLGRSRPRSPVPAWHVQLPGSSYAFGLGTRCLCYGRLGTWFCRPSLFSWIGRFFQRNTHKSPSYAGPQALRELA